MFDKPVYLWLLLGLCVLIITYFVDIGWRRNKGMVFANMAIIERITRKKILQRSMILFMIRAIAVVMVIFALSEMIIWYDGTGANSDFVFAIDASGSMLANDYQPSRLEAAKSTATEILQVLDMETEIGIVSFAGTSLLTQTLTNDRIELKASINNIETISVGGTAMGEAVILGTNLLSIKKELSRGKTIILITDGQNNVGIKPEDAVEFANQKGVIISTIGIGTEEGGQFAEASAISQLDEETLREIAESTGGIYLHPRDNEELKSALLKIIKLEKRKISFNAQVPLLLIAAFLLFIEWILVNTEYRIRP